MKTMEERYRLAWFFGISLVIHSLFLSIHVRKAIIHPGEPLEIVLGEVAGKRAIKGENAFQKQKRNNKKVSQPLKQKRKKRAISHRLVLKKEKKGKGRKRTKRRVLASASIPKPKKAHHESKASSERQKSSSLKGLSSNKEDPKNKKSPVSETGTTGGKKFSDGTNLHRTKTPKRGLRLGQRGLKNYLSLVRTIIEKHKYYPYNARIFGRQGNVKVSFTIEKDGTIKMIKLLRTCRFKDLNLAAIRTLKRAGPLPPPPKSIEPPLKVAFTLKFNIRD